MSSFTHELRDRLSRLRPRISAGFENLSGLKPAGVDTSSIRKPGFCCLGVVDTCVLKCRMCNKWKSDLYVRDQRKPTLEQWKRVISQLRDLTDEDFEIDFGGGEALMLPGLLELVRHAADLGFTTTIASNGWLIDDELARRIAASGLSKMILSVDSLDPKIHDTFRGVEGTHKRVLAAIDHLHRHRRDDDFIIGICSIIMEPTLPGILDLYNWVKTDPRLRHILFMAVMQPNNSEERFDKAWYDRDECHDLWPRDQARLDAIFNKLKEFRREGFLISNTLPQLEAQRQYFREPESFVKTSTCNMDTALHVSAVGDVFCCFKWDILGNITEEGTDVRELWYSAAAEKARTSIRNCEDNCHFLLNCYFEAGYPFEVKKNDQPLREPTPGNGYLRTTSPTGSSCCDRGAPTNSSTTMSG
ncbi:MAG: hypothetical protein A2284_16850 [Deltaproteobacteria bacterium RIFOXYA12_FULL_61_11]|nr:MAG: hypothetical protein A2284_16850 [Deltaproteobacteria bacterium RIFOXYA12_FULL_61_11]